MKPERREFGFSVEIPVLFWVRVEGTVEAEVPDEEDASPSAVAEDEVYDKLGELLELHDCGASIRFEGLEPTGFTVTEVAVCSSLPDGITVDDARVLMDGGE